MPRPGNQPQINKVTDHPFKPQKTGNKGNLSDYAVFDGCATCRLDEQSHTETMVCRDETGKITGVGNTESNNQMTMFPERQNP
jgi:hypothetical protein